MSVFICDKARLPFLKPFNKLAVRVLSGMKHSAIASCFKPDKTFLLVY